MLTEISEAPNTALGRFFKLAKSLTIDGYYASKEGLTQELAWNAKTHLPEFKAALTRSIKVRSCKSNSLRRSTT